MFLCSPRDSSRPRRNENTPKKKINENDAQKKPTHTQTHADTLHLAAGCGPFRHKRSSCLVISRSVSFFIATRRLPFSFPSLPVVSPALPSFTEFYRVLPIRLFDSQLHRRLRLRNHRLADEFVSSCFWCVFFLFLLAKMDDPRKDDWPNRFQAISDSRETRLRHRRRFFSLFGAARVSRTSSSAAAAAAAKRKKKQKKRHRETNWL